MYYGMSMIPFNTRELTDSAVAKFDLVALLFGCHVFALIF